MKIIPLTLGLETVVDDDQYEYLSQWNWHSHDSGSGYYAARGGKHYDGTGKLIYMHRVILKRLGYDLTGMDGRHIDRNKLNNCTSNLKIVTPMESRQNRVKRRNGVTSKYIGVNKNRNKYVARIYKDGERIHLGRFDSEIDAAIARDLAVIALGSFSPLNFPNNYGHNITDSK